MYSKMLLPLDGSDLAESMLPYAAAVAGTLGLDVLIVRVVDPAKTGGIGEYEAYLDERAARIAEEAATQCRTTQGRYAPPVVSAELVYGADPATKIIEYATERQIDFMLMSTHGHSSVSHWVVGSVAEKVMRVSTVPVWLIRGALKDPEGYKTTLGRILVLLDGSPLSEAVLPHVETLVKQSRCPVVTTLVHVVEFKDVLSDYPEAKMQLTWEQHVTEKVAWATREARHYLEEIKQRLERSHAQVETEVLSGRPTEQLLSYLGRHPDAVVALSIYGRSGFTRWSFGTVADRLIHSVENPQFIVRPARQRTG